MRTLAKTKFTMVGAIVILLLVACSYNHGIMRILTFDQNVTDLSCLKNELEKLWHKVHDYNESITYEPQSKGTYPSPQMSITIQKISNGDGTYKTDPQTLVHSADFGSGPANCKIVKDAEFTLETIENNILKACKLIPIKEPKKHLRCG